MWAGKQGGRIFLIDAPLDFLSQLPSMEKEIISSIFSQKEGFAVLGNADLYIITLFPRAGREGCPSVPDLVPTRLRAKRFPFVALQGDHVKRYLRHDIFESEWGSISNCTRTAGVRLGSGRAGHEIPLFTGVPAIFPGLEGLARVSGYGTLVSDRGRQGLNWHWVTRSWRRST